MTPEERIILALMKESRLAEQKARRREIWAELLSIRSFRTVCVLILATIIGCWIVSAQTLWSFVLGSAVVLGFIWLEMEVGRSGYRE